MMWASAEIFNLEVSIPLSFNPLISFNKTAGSITTPFPITGTTSGVNIPEGRRCRANFSGPFLVGITTV